MGHARETALAHQSFMSFRPGWDGSAVRGPVRVCRFVTPFHKARHDFCVRPGAAKCLHRSLAFPDRQSPECVTSVDQKPSAQKSRSACDLALRKKGHPQK